MAGHIVMVGRKQRAPVEASHPLIIQTTPAIPFVQKVPQPYYLKSCIHTHEAVEKF